MVNLRSPPSFVKKFKKWVWCLCIVFLTLIYVVLVNFTEKDLLPKRILITTKLSDLQAHTKFERDKFVLTGSSLVKEKNLELKDVLISVKTSEKFYSNRLEIILKTWFTLAPKQIYYFTDTTNEDVQKQTDGHFINTGCGKEHTRTDLTCKMAAEYDYFMTTSQKWWCHFDDDNYVNVYALVNLLQKFDFSEDIYVGKPSMLKPITSLYHGEQVAFRFATGGAGMCISRSLAEKMAPWCRRGALLKTSNELRFPDDCTIGFVITDRLSVNLTHSRLFHSHLESLTRIAPKDLEHQVSFSYHISDSYVNTVDLEPDQALFNTSVDPTRFFSLHCILYPSTPYCKSARHN